MQPKGLLKFLKLEELVQNLSEYVENKIAITKLEYKQKIADVLATVAIMLPVAVLGLFAFLFLNIGAAMGINVWLDSRAWGFVIVGGFYLLIALILFTQRNAAWVKKIFVDGTTKMLKEKPEPTKKEGYKEPTYNPSNVEHKKIIFEEEQLPASKPVVSSNGTQNYQVNTVEEPVPQTTYGGSPQYTAGQVKEPKQASEIERYRKLQPTETTEH